MVLLLHSQHQYIFDYDSGDRLSAVTMPSVARHTMQTIRSIGYYRNIYTPPESNASVTVDYSEEGQVRANHTKVHVASLFDSRLSAFNPNKILHDDGKWTLHSHKYIHTLKVEADIQGDL